MELKLPYGKSQVKLSIAEAEKIDPRDPPRSKPTETPGKLIRKRLSKPLACKTIQGLVEEKFQQNKSPTAAILIDDKTRPCPDDLLAPLLVDKLISSGVSPKNITIVVATGLHEPPSRGEAKKAAGGDDLPEGIQYIGHDAVNSEMKEIGEVSHGYEIAINRSVAEADLKLSTGFIEPHFFAGFSGGRKSVLPGVASKSSILANHSYKNIAHQNATTGVLTGNPVHEGALEAADMVGLDFVLNVVLNKDKEIVDAIAGNHRVSLGVGVARDIEVCTVKLSSYYDAVLTTNSGYPLDQNLYQTVKGIYTASLVAKPGAPIIVVSECSEGIGPDTFYSLMEDSSTPSEVLYYIEKHGPIVAQWQNQVLCDVLKNHEVFLKSSLNNEKVKAMGLQPIENLPAFIKQSLKELDKNQKMLALPEGPYAFPYVRGSSLSTKIEKLKD